MTDLLTHLGGGNIVCPATGQKMTEMPCPWHAWDQDIHYTKAHLWDEDYPADQCPQGGHCDGSALYCKGLNNASHTAHVTNVVQMVRDVHPLLQPQQFPGPPEYLVDGFIPKLGRMGVTGAEGAGKSTALRQWGLQAARGVHPFTLAEVPPIRVLLLDLENDPEWIQQSIDSMGGAPEGFVWKSYVDYIDLRDSDGSDAKAVYQLLKMHRPDWWIAGPTYKMLGDADEATDTSAIKVLTRTIDHWRSELGFATTLEQHTPHAPMGGKRPIRPSGSSVWLRWCQLGMYLTANGKLLHWRNPRVPVKLTDLQRNGDPWPWMPIGSTEEENKLRAAILARLVDGQVYPSKNKLIDGIGNRNQALKEVDNLVEEGVVSKTEQGFQLAG